MVKYPKTSAEDYLVHRELFINSTYLADNKGDIVTGSLNFTKINSEHGNHFQDDCLIQYLKPELGKLLKTGIFTLRIRGYLPNLGTGGGPVWGWYVDLNNRVYVEIPRTDQDMLRFIYNINGAGVITYYSNAGSLTTGLNDIVMTFNGATWIVYINGVLANMTGSSADLSGMVGDTNMAFGGADCCGISTANGIFTVFEVYDKILTEKEALNLCQQDTFIETDASNTGIYLPLKTHYDSGGIEVTTNLGQADSDNCLWGDGSTASTFPTLLANNGASFDGGDYINLDGILPVPVSPEGTFAALIRVNDPTVTQEIISFGDTNADTRIQFDINNSKLRALVREAGTTQWALETDGPVSSQWVHVAIVQDGSDPILYVNGIAVAQTFTTSTNKTYWINDLGGLDNCRIGCGNWNNGGDATFLTGAIKYPIMTVHTLTQTQVKWLCNRAFRELNI